MAAAAVPRSLSDLPDDVLRRILFFAPAREGASTAVLSRRWRYLWRASGAVNLDSRSLIRRSSSYLMGLILRSSSDEPKDIVLHGAGAPITRLTIALAEESRPSGSIHIHLAHPDDLVGAEELLRVEVNNNDRSQQRGGGLSVFSLPSQALRLLRISNCSSLTAAPPAAAFPLLSELRLHGCAVPTADLQRIADAAPQLAMLHLESCYIEAHVEHQGLFHIPPPAPEIQRRLLAFPAVADLVLAGCIYERRATLELDVPRLRCFRYHGSLQHCNQVSLKQQAASPNNNMVKVDLCLRDEYYQTTGDQQVLEAFWQFIRNFIAAKVLKIELDYHLALTDDRSRQDELLGSLSFPNLERLELQVGYEPANNAASMVMLANLLHCCPVLQNLRVKLINQDGRMVLSSVDKEARADFDKSVNRFRRRRRSPMISLGGEEDDNENHEVCYIPGLSGESFNCLRSYLRRVSLHFCMEAAGCCLGVQLAKFFAENAMVLEEIYLHDGSKKMAEHMNASVRRWIANLAKTRNNLAGGVEVLPHY